MSSWDGQIATSDSLIIVGPPAFYTVVKKETISPINNSSIVNVVTNVGTCRPRSGGELANYMVVSGGHRVHITVVSP